MPHRIIFLAVVLLCFSGQPVFAKTEAITPKEVIAKYLEAMGGDRLSSITTFVEKGEVQRKITNPNVANLGRITSQSLPPQQQRARYEFYFKSPNLRFSSNITENNLVMALHGCDGNVAWYIDASLKHRELPPKTGQQSECDEGFAPFPQPLRAPNVKMHLEGQKKIDGHVAWEIKVEIPKSDVPEIFYFDAETLLLIRLSWRNYAISYSDYRDVGGIKQPFTIVREDLAGKVFTTVREIRINVPIDDARFAQPQIKNGRISLDPVPRPRTEEAQAPQAASPKAPAPSTAAAPTTEINFPNFTACTIEELQLLVPELHGLKPVSDQGALNALLEKIGNRLFDIARNTPNLISHEVVSESQKGVAEKRREYDYLILTRIEGAEIALNEYRVDLATGDKFQTDEANHGSAAPSTANPAELGGANHDSAPSQPGEPPLSQGFATSWVHFYPHNQPRSAFRYLGEQKVGGHHAVVVAFAQKPQAVRSPGLLSYKGKSVPMFLQGVAWFDTSDFQILRLQTDLLSPLPDISLDRLSANVKFMPTRVADVSSVLVLPQDVTVTSVVGGTTLREHHSYSDYRLFRARSKILLNP
jgi:hypothetical protein